MKKSRHRSPVWPYLGILSCLFVLSLLAPRGWERSARVRPINKAPDRESGQSDRRVDESVALESSDDAELAPPEAEFESAHHAAYSAVPTKPIDMSGVWGVQLIPPAPEYAQQVREEEFEIAARPALPRAPEPRPAAEPTPQAEVAPAEPVISAPALDAPDASDPQPPAEPEGAPAVAASGWPMPRILVEQLTNLTHEDAQLIWARRAIQLIQELSASDEPRVRRASIEKLRELVARDAVLPPADRSLLAQIGVRPLRADALGGRVGDRDHARRAPGVRRAGGQRSGRRPRDWPTSTRWRSAIRPEPIGATT